MTKQEKIDKVIQTFSLLSEINQDRILGILQAMVYAYIEKTETIDSGFKESLAVLSEKSS